MFPPDAALPQVFDETKDQEDMKNSWNSVLDLLVYSKCLLNEILDHGYKTTARPKTLTLLDDGMSCLGWHCTFRIVVNTV